jgi:hypothetical protein
MPLLKEIALTADRPIQPSEAALENMSRVVCALFVQGLKKQISPPDFWKISIRINSRDTSEDGNILLGVLVANRGFPITEFLGLTQEQRQHYMLDFVSSTVRDIFLKRGLDIFPLEGAVSYVVEHKFKNVIIGSKRFQSPGGTEVAHIQCEQEMDEARIYVVSQAKIGPPRRALVATTAPEEFIFQALFGRIEWNDSLHPILRKVDGTSIPINFDGLTNNNSRHTS